MSRTCDFSVHNAPDHPTVKVRTSGDIYWINIEERPTDPDCFRVTFFFRDDHDRRCFMKKVCEAFLEALHDAPMLPPSSTYTND